VRPQDHEPRLGVAIELRPLVSRERVLDRESVLAVATFHADVEMAVAVGDRNGKRLGQRRVAGAHVVTSASRRASSSSTIDGSSLRKITVGACSGVPTSIGMLSHRAAAAA